jgi:peptidoglycan/LPS O-acetylase OafA/YrhL
MGPAKERIFGLDVIRATVVFFVALHHLSPLVALPGWLGRLSTLGSLGVELLFVLSGFLLGQTLLRTIHENHLLTWKKAFSLLTKRWRRIVPAYYFFFFITAAAFPPFFRQITHHLQYFFFLQNFAWKMPGFYFQTWALGILEFFYVLFTLSIFLCYKICRQLLPSFFICISLFWLLPFLLRAACLPLLGPAEFQATIRPLVIYRLDAPVAGVIMAVLLREFPHVWNGVRRHSWIGLSLFAGTVAYYLADFPFLYTNHWLEILFYPAVCATFALTLPILWAWKENPSLPGRAISLVSKASYSLYISHVIAIVLGFYLLELILGVAYPTGLIVYPVCLGLALLIAWLSYRFIESPFMGSREKNAPKSSYFLAIYQAIRRKVKSPLPAGPADAPPAKPAELTNE